MEKHEILTFFIMAAGALTGYCSIHSAIYFFKVKQKIHGVFGRFFLALFFALVGEFLVVVGTMAFSIAEHVGCLDHWNVYLKSFIRFFMFTASGTTTLYLLIIARKVTRLSTPELCHEIKIAMQSVNYSKGEK